MAAQQEFEGGIPGYEPYCPICGNSFELERLKEKREFYRGALRGVIAAAVVNIAVLATAYLLR